MKRSYVATICISVAAMLLLVTTNSAAWETYSTDGTTGNCATCHGEFKGNDYTSNSDGTPWNDHLMKGHENFIDDSDKCNVCHSGADKSPTFLNLSDLTEKPQGCVGCHGRVGDESGVCAFGIADSGNKHCGSAAGLRNVHNSAGVTSCFACHSNDNGATLVGEDELPFNYSLAGTISDPCTAENQFGPTGLDNDGDGTVDSADADCAPPAPTPGDFDADGMSDILWRNSSTGQNWLYEMNSAAVNQSLGINTVPSPWEIVGNGDYDGDGDADILWRNSSTGQNWMYLIDSGTIDNSVSVNTVSTVWKVAGNGDYDGDGKADILWRNSDTGQNWMYLMNGALIDSSLSVNTVPIVWKVEGSGDYDGDGKADILWRNSSTGQNWMYLMMGATIDSSVSVNTVPAVWQIAGDGDFNGDGKADILWHNSSTGQNWLYLMTGATIDSSVGINTVSNTQWQIVGDGDYNGDGNADVLWRNSSTGQNWMYLMTGATIDSSVAVNTVSDTAWQIVNTR